MKSRKHIRRILAATLALIMALALAVPAFAVEVNQSDHCTVPDCTLCSPKTATYSTKSAGVTKATVTSFSDVPEGHTFHDAILWCASQGIVGGYDDGTFRPSNTVTRSNFAVMLSRAFYASEVAANQLNPAYTQIGTFYPNFMALKNNGILDGTSWVKAIDSTSVMNQGISRFDMAILMTNIMKQKGFAASESEKSNAIPKITDYNDIWASYRDAVANVYALGIITGYADGSFNGNGIMTRGAACIVIYRMMQYSNNGGGDIQTPDPEVPVDPESGEIACACVNLNGECKCMGTASSGSGNTGSSSGNTGNTGNSGNTGDTGSSTPSTMTLRDGSAVTEENVLKIINEILKVYPNGTTWNANTTRNNNTSIGGYTLGTPSSAVMQIQTNHNSSMTKACGGFAGLVSDAIFGGANTGGDKFPIRKLNSVSQIRPGDIIVRLNSDGTTDHIMTAASRIRSSKTANNVQIYCIWAYHGNSNGSVVYDTYDSCYITDELYRDSQYVAYTRYPS